MSLIEKIQDLCSSKNTTLIGLEREIGLGRGTIRNWGKSSPSTDKLQKVANYFKVSIDYLLDRGNIYDVGFAIKEEREDQGLSEKELANEVGINEFELSQYESDEIPLTKELADKIAKVLGMSFSDLLVKYDMYDEYIPPEFDGDPNAYTSYRTAVDKDAMSESRLPPLTPKDERDIARDLEKMLSNLENREAMAFYDGEPLDEESKELLRISLENSMRLAKQMAKKKFTPKKYRKEE